MSVQVEPGHIGNEAQTSGLLLSAEPLGEGRVFNPVQGDAKTGERVEGSDARAATGGERLKDAGFERLAKLVEPCPVDEFLEAYWGRTFKHVRGWPGKFSHLLPWERLNDIMRRHRMDQRLTLVREAKVLPVSAFMQQLISSRNKAPISRLMPVKMTEHLRQGATIALSSVDRLYEPLEELVEELELMFHEYVQINAYAGWRSSRGFNLHWDEHEVLILQVSGRKRWSLYGTTRAYPVAEDNHSEGRPTHEPIWEETLEEGDLLYIPRGCWHVATPLDEPTLHLTVGVHHRTGLDLLRWFTERMRSSEVFRKDLPHFADDSARALHIEQLGQEFLSYWRKDPIKRFYDETGSLVEPRERLSLPWSATPEVLPASDDVLLRLTASRLIDLKYGDGVVEFTCNKKHWRFAEVASVILGPLVERRVCSLAELFEEAAGQLDEQTVRTFVGELILLGLLAVSSD